MTTKTALINVMSQHHGREKGISARYLALYLSVTPRDLRKLISQCRYEDGAAICGHPSTGYFIATTADELDLCCKFLEHRALHSLQLLSKMKKVSMPALVGQLLLNQA